MAQNIRPDEDGSRRLPAHPSVDAVKSPQSAPPPDRTLLQAVPENSSAIDNNQRALADAVPAPSMAEFEETLKRLVDRIAKILQADKCVFMLHDSVSGTLYPTLPAIGFDTSQFVGLERRVSDEGITSEVFRTNTPVILYDAAHDPRAAAEDLPALGVRNGVSVPLVVEKRDDQNRVTERTIVGVLHVFNKKYEGQFVDEDVRLLQRMAMMAAAVFSSAEMYREAAQEKQELIHTIDSLMAGLLLVGSNGRLLQINPSARAILKINRNIPLVGVPYHRAVPNERVRALLERALTSGIGEVADEITVKMRRDAANGADEKGRVGASPENLDRIYQVQCAPVRDGQGAPAGVVAIFNDITEIRSVERMKDDFLSTVSHELRTPLTSIKGFVSTLLTDTDNFFDAEQRREFYEIMDTECDRLTRLIDDLLNISRIEQGRAMQIHWQQVDLVSIVRKVVTTQATLVKLHELIMDFPDDFPLVDGDSDKLGQIMTNLIDNAIKYSPRGGKVSITGRVATEDPTAIAVSIADQGIGVPPEHLPRIFDRFYRVDNRDNREIGGTGIGLALVKALVEAHHGRVIVESEPGMGSTFTVVLPVEHKGARAAATGGKVPISAEATRGEFAGLAPGRAESSVNAHSGEANAGSH